MPNTALDRSTITRLTAAARKHICDGTHHMLQSGAWGNKRCKACRTALCNHYRFGLRGCMRTDKHDSLHVNHSAPNEAWTDAEGRYVMTQDDWVGMIDRNS